MRPNGIYTATVASDSISATTVSLIEVQVPTNVQIEILRVWVGPAEGADPVAEVQEIELYINDGPATGGTGLTEQAIQGSDDAASACTSLEGPTTAASTVPVYNDAFHAQNGFLYLPVPEERIRVAGGSTNDNFGMRFNVTPDGALVISSGITWAEFG